MDPAVERAIRFGQAGLLERLSGEVTCPRTARRLREKAAVLRGGRDRPSPPPGGMCLPVALWDEAMGAGVAAFLRVFPTPVDKFEAIPSTLLPDAAESFLHAARGAWSVVERRWGAGGGGFPRLFRAAFLTPAGRPLREAVQGRSASASAAAGAFALIAGIDGPADFCVLGEVGPDGRLHPVDRCAEKLEALAREGVPLRHAWVVGPPMAPAKLPFPVRSLPAGSPLEGMFREVFGAAADTPPRLQMLTEAELERGIERLERDGDPERLERLRDLLESRSPAGERLFFLLHRALGSLYGHRGRARESGAHLGHAAGGLDALVAGDRLDPEDAADLCNRLGVFHTDLHHWEEAGLWFSRGRRFLTGRAGRSARIARARLDASEGQMRMWSGDPGKAEPLLRAARDLLGEARHLNYLAGALILGARRAALRGGAADAGRLEEARECLDRSLALGDLSGEPACLANSAFVLYWRARLAFEAGEDPSRLREAVERVETAGGPVFPLALARVWLALAEKRPGPSEDPGGAAAAVRRLRTGEPGPLFPLLALGATLRLWARPEHRPALLAAWDVPAGAAAGAGPTPGSAGILPATSFKFRSDCRQDAGAPTDCETVRKERAPVEAEGAALLEAGPAAAREPGPAAILPALVEVLSALSPLTPAFEAELARFRSLLLPPPVPPPAPPPAAGLLPALAALAERIGY